MNNEKDPAKPKWTKCVKCAGKIIILVVLCINVKGVHTDWMLSCAAVSPQFSLILF